VVAVTHDRYFLDNAAEWILELDRGMGIPYKGNYSDWLEQKRDRLQKEESSESARQKALKRELEWVRKSAKGQQKKNIARLKRFEELNSYEYQRRNETAEIFIPVAERLGNEITFIRTRRSDARMLVFDGVHEWSDAVAEAAGGVMAEIEATTGG
jgi:sulfate-transporting ATPase